MPESQRVLSGSATRGSSATLTGSVQYFYQGINANTLTSYVGSLLPRMGSGDRLEIRRNGAPLSKKTYDDSITINNDLKDIGEGSDASQRISEAVVFPLERLAFGQPPSTVRGEPFADMTSFNPVTYIQDQNEFMWPVNLWNLGSLPDHEYDGVIEPLDVRREALGHSDLRYEGRTIRGALVGAASERPWGSIEISDTWSINEPSPYAFLDSPLVISSSAPSKNPSKEINPLAIQAYQDIRQSSLNPLRETDYHDKVYSSIISHNDEDMRSALRLLNSSSCDSFTDPLQKTATRGVSLDSSAGSITFNNILVVGEY